MAGSSGDYLSVADTVLQMDCYETKDVTARAKELAVELTEETVKKTDWLKKTIRTKRIEKAKVHGWDTISLDKNEIDLRYLEQIVGESQTAALAYYFPSMSWNGWPTERKPFLSSLRKSPPSWRKKGFWR